MRLLENYYLISVLFNSLLLNYYLYVKNRGRVSVNYKSYVLIVFLFLSPVTFIFSVVMFVKEFTNRIRKKEENAVTEPEILYNM